MKFATISGSMPEVLSRPELEDRLVREESLRHAIESSMLAGVAVIDHEGVQTHVNPAMCNMVGWRQEELLGGRPPFLYWPPEEIPKIEAAFAATLAGEAPRGGYELRFRRKNGQRFDALVLISELREVSGRSRGWLASIYDVSEWKRAVWRLRVLAEASEVLSNALDPESLLRALADFSVVTIADYCVTYSFDGEREIERVGIAHRAPEKRGIVADLVRAGRPRIEDAYGAGMVIRTGESILATEIPAELLARAAQNAEHLRVLRELAPRSSMVVPLSARGRTVGAIAFTATDDSGLRYDKDDLILALELAGRAALLLDNARLYREAQSAIAKRDELVAFVSHDLKNPIQVQLAACSVLRRPEASPEQLAGATEAIERSAVQMQRLIAGLLDLARLDAGGLAVRRRRLDVDGLLQEGARSIAPLAEQKSVTIEQRVEPGLPPVDGDREQLLQVLSNLLGNAVKFVAEGGKIELCAERQAELVRVLVSDDGPGIVAEELGRVFDRFWQSSRARSEGTGLGLAIAKGIVEAHGGQIGAISPASSGATFWFTLPASTPT